MLLHRVRWGRQFILGRTIKRAKYQPIWIPGPNFPDDPMDIYEQMKPSMRGDEIVWQHFPPKRPAPGATANCEKTLRL